jgi:hypothetical protein
VFTTEAHPMSRTSRCGDGRGKGSRGKSRTVGSRPCTGPLSTSVPIPWDALVLLVVLCVGLRKCYQSSCCCCCCKTSTKQKKESEMV